MKTIKTNLVVLLVLTLFLSIGCDDDSPVTPDPFGSISGIVTFSGSWPITGTVSITLQGDWYIDSGQGYPSGYPSSIIGGMETFVITQENYSEGQAYAYEINDILIVVIK